MFTLTICNEYFAVRRRKDGVLGFRAYGPDQSACAAASDLLQTEDGAAVGRNLGMEGRGGRNVLVAEEIVDGVLLIR